MPVLKIPDAPMSIQKGFPLKMILDKAAVQQLSENLKHVHAPFDKAAFAKAAMKVIEPLDIKERSAHIASAMQKQLPDDYRKAIGIMLQSLTPPLKETEGKRACGIFLHGPLQLHN